MRARDKSWPLSIYLLKREIGRSQAAIRPHPALRRISIGRGRGTLGTLYYRTTEPRTPRWVEFFGSHVDPRDFRASSIAAVLLLHGGGRQFAVTFGHGRFILDPASYEEGFGLRVTLNSVTPERIRTIDRKALDATGRHTREQASRNIPIIEFGLDIDKDILQAVTGPPEDSSLGKRLAGADVLSVVLTTTLRDLPSQLGAYLSQSRKRAYRNRFPWVDNIQELRDPSKVALLDEELVARIRDRQFDRLWLAVPDLIDWRDVGGFTFSRVEGTEPVDDISFSTYLEHVRRPDELALETLRRHRVFCISAESDLPRDEWPLYRCIYAEIERAGDTFLLNNGKWYQVERNYLREVNNAVRRIPASHSLQFPRFNDASEAGYNRRVRAGDPSQFALMDGRTIRYGGGSSRIEFCDLYTRRREMIHVKRYGGSSVLSHLFAQGLVSANLFLSDSVFRGHVNRLLPSSHRFRATSDRPNPSDFEVAYAIASKDEGPLVLPFFSKVTLRSAHQQLQNMGYSVTLTKIQCE